MDATSSLDTTLLATLDAPEDRAAIERALIDAHAFDALYHKYVADIYRYCYRRLEDREAAEDATSHIFMQAYAALPTLGSKPFRPWLFAIARNAVIDAYRRRRPPDASLDRVMEQRDGATTLEEQAIDRESVDAIHALFSQLNERDRQIVELRLAGLTGVEIARTLQCSPAVVRTAQHRAFVKIRALLAHSEQGELPARAKGTWQ